MHEVDEQEESVPEECVESAQNDPAPDGEEGRADGQHDPQVDEAANAARCQVRQEQERVGQLKVDVIDWQPL